MKFIPSPQEDPSSIIKNLYYWQESEYKNDQLDLYKRNKRVASISLLESDEDRPSFRVNNETYEFQDSSSFFEARLILRGTENDFCTGNIEKKPGHPVEGSVNFLNGTYGWKIHSKPDPYLVLMDQHRNRLFSYHYRPDYVRLILNKAGKNEEQIIPLLCIGLFLLPVWVRKSEVGCPPVR